MLLLAPALVGRGGVLAGALQHLHSAGFAVLAARLAPLSPAQAAAMLAAAPGRPAALADALCAGPALALLLERSNAVTCGRRLLEECVGGAGGRGEHCSLTVNRRQAPAGLFVCHRARVHRVPLGDGGAGAEPWFFCGSPLTFPPGRLLAGRRGSPRPAQCSPRVMMEV